MPDTDEVGRKVEQFLVYVNKTLCQFWSIPIGRDVSFRTAV